MNGKPENPIRNSIQVLRLEDLPWTTKSVDTSGSGVAHYLNSGWEVISAQSNGYDSWRILIKARGNK